MPYPHMPISGSPAPSPGQFTYTGFGGAVYGQPVYASGAGLVSLAEANAIGTSVVVGVIAAASVAPGGFSCPSSPQATSSGKQTTAAWDAIAGTVGGLAPNTTYYLSPTTAGHYTSVAPSTVGQTVVPLALRALADDSGAARDRPAHPAVGAPCHPSKKPRFLVLAALTAIAAVVVALVSAETASSTPRTPLVVVNGRIDAAPDHSTTASPRRSRGAALGALMQSVALKRLGDLHRSPAVAASVSTDGASIGGTWVWPATRCTRPSAVHAVPIALSRRRTARASRRARSSSTPWAWGSLRRRGRSAPTRRTCRSASRAPAPTASAIFDHVTGAGTGCQYDTFDGMSDFPAQMASRRAPTRTTTTPASAASLHGAGSRPSAANVNITGVLAGSTNPEARSMTFLNTDWTTGHTLTLKNGRTPRARRTIESTRPTQGTGSSRPARRLRSSTTPVGIAGRLRIICPQRRPPRSPAARRTRLQCGRARARSARARRPTTA